ncbi:MAG TPA: hypothetical protein VHN16_00950 [Streptosporangiaceae bacterium]|nr:hypothetical protein [Streptosporangiaceae bacterium]
MSHTHPKTDIDLQQISTRNGYARNVVVGFASGWPTLADWWQALQDALYDTVTLSAQVTRLSADLERARLDRANLLAAMRAALAAQAEGESDPLWYLRDELSAAESLPADSRGAK